MNKQEAIERIKKFSEYPGTYPCAIVRTPNVVEVINCIDETQKVKVPEFINRIIENAGGRREENKEYVIRSVVDDYYQEKWEKFVLDWFNRRGNLLKFYRAVESGYEVEEPKYRVLLPHRSSNSKRITVLRKNQRDGISIAKVLPNAESEADYLTEKEIKSVDERYWPFAVPVEKV